MKNPNAYVLRGWGIVNPYGGIWTHEIFATEDDARRHLEEFGKSMKPWNPKGFRFVRVKLTVEAEE